MHLVVRRPPSGPLHKIVPSSHHSNLCFLNIWLLATSFLVHTYPRTTLTINSALELSQVRFHRHRKFVCSAALPRTPISIYFAPTSSFAVVIRWEVRLWEGSSLRSSIRSIAAPSPLHRRLILSAIFGTFQKPPGRSSLASNSRRSKMDKGKRNQATRNQY